MLFLIFAGDYAQWIDQDFGHYSPYYYNGGRDEGRGSLCVKAGFVENLQSAPFLIIAPFCPFTQ